MLPTPRVCLRGSGAGPLEGAHCRTAVLSAGELAHMVERSLSMREVPGSIPGFSKLFADNFHFLKQFFKLSSMS